MSQEWNFVGRLVKITMLGNWPLYYKIEAAKYNLGSQISVQLRDQSIAGMRAVTDGLDIPLNIQGRRLL